MAGSCATDACEPCQVLTEAALSESVCVPRVCLAGATGKRTVRRGAFKEWVHGFFKKFSVTFLVTLFFYTVNCLSRPAGGANALPAEAASDAVFCTLKPAFAPGRGQTFPALAASGAVFLRNKPAFVPGRGRAKAFRQEPTRFQLQTVLTLFFSFSF